MTRTVTVGLDGSRESLAAARWAALEATRRGLPLRIAQVWETRAHPPVDPRAQERWERIPDEVTAELVRRHPGLEVVVDRLAGRPAEVLRDSVDEAEVLVLGSRGRGALAGFLVGSVALSTVAHVACPVVLVRAGAEGEEISAEPAGDVVVGVDLTRPHEEVAAFAFGAADRRGVVLEVLHGWDPPPVYGISPVAVGPHLLDDLAEEKALALENAVRPWRERYPDVEVRTRAVIGRVSHHLLDASEHACLVVVGRRGRRSPLGFHTGPVTHAVMHHCAAPVAVVPHA
ncbi:universal stress protein [Streptomyces sp. TRM43335]|uniref:Universal stress protein n=1 Tax=Streptomyces taklimakanensis TaxID=2569853 RepID=A0A6G2B868_9ACTN|nr:universal stress protein [Streptomyces taklimakanensis]MTE18102.1 universal stress protein [Streptomyces taklimakanensis]